MVTQVQDKDYDQNGLHWSKSADPHWQLAASIGSKDSLASPSDIDSKILSMQHFSGLSPPASAVTAHQFSKSQFRRADSYKFTLVVRLLLFVLELGTCIYFYAISRSGARKAEEEEELKFDAAFVALIAALLIDGSVVTAVLTKHYLDLWAVMVFVADVGCMPSI